MQPTITEKVSFIERTFGKGIVSRSGEDIAVSCPLCKDAKKKKLSISLSTWSFHCWVCNEKGKTLVPILRKSKSRELVNFYREKFLNQHIIKDIAEKEEEIVFEYPEGFVPIVNLLGSRSPNVRAAISYLSSRGVNEPEMYRYRIGMTPTGRDPRRIFFISLDDQGDENYFVSRSIDDQSRYRYINSKVDKTSIVFNECDINWDEPIFLVEGVFDQISLNRNSAVILGSSLLPTSLIFRKLVLNESHVIMALDHDAQDKAKKIADSLIEYGCKVQFMNIPDQKDLGSMSRDEIEESVARITDWSARTSLLSRIHSIRSGSIL